MPIILCDSLSFPGLERTFKLLPNNKKRPVYPSRHTDTSIWHAWPFSSASETQPIWSFMMTEVNNHKNDIYTHTHTHTHRMSFDIQRTVHRDTYSYNKSQRDALFLKFIFDKELMFWTDLLSIIRSLNTVPSLAC